MIHLKQWVKKQMLIIFVVLILGILNVNFELFIEIFTLKK